MSRATHHEVNRPSAPLGAPPVEADDQLLTVDTTAALDLLASDVARAGLSLGDQVAFAIDVAGTHFYDPSRGAAALAPRRKTIAGQPPA